MRLVEFSKETGIQGKVTESAEKPWDKNGDWESEVLGAEVENPNGS